MLPLGGDNGRGRAPSEIRPRNRTGSNRIYATREQPTFETMITQNPIIGRAKKKLGGIYARTLYGKNVLQSCPPSAKGRQAPSQVASSACFGKLSQLSNQVSSSLLNSIYYQAPTGRSRRAEWCSQLAKGMKKTLNGWQFDPSQIVKLGSNHVVSVQPLELEITSTQVSFPLSLLSMVGSAIPTETPCIILICPDENICISLVDYTQIENDVVTLSPLSTTLLNKQCWLFPLWQVNEGTTRNPANAYGSFELSL